MDFCITSALEAIQSLGKRTVIVQGGTCFAASTKVLMADGSYKDIDKIKAGDKILSRVGECGIIKTEVAKSWCAGYGKPMLSIIINGEEIKSTYDHKFYTAEGYKELYKIAWGSMEARQRSQLKLLCEQYGSPIDDQSSWWQEGSNYETRQVYRLPSEFWGRQKLLSENVSGWEALQNTQTGGRNFYTESREQTTSQSQERGQIGQPSRESGVGNSTRECTARLQREADASEVWGGELSDQANRTTGQDNQKAVGHRSRKAQSQTIRREIRGQGMHHQGHFGEQKLEMVAIDSVQVAKWEKIFALETGHKSHNYFVSKSNINVSNSAGKTIAILLILLNYALENSDKVVTIMTDSYPNLRAGAMRDWLKICRQTNVLSAAEWNKAESTMRFTNGTLVEFKACDNMGALGARRDVLYVNEANRISFDTFTNLEVRTKEKIYLDFNPINEFWAHRELLKQPDVDFIKLTYLDNEGLDDRIVKAIEDKKGDGTSNWWRVYGLGEVGSLEGNVYSGWKPADKPKNAKLIRYGLDFGFSNDETALVAIYACGDGALWLEQLIYEKGLLGSQYPAKLASVGVDPSVLILADGARPEIIAEIKRAGYRCIAADKGPGSVLKGIDYVSQHQISYNPTSKDLEREFLTYAWRKKKSTGEIMDEPEDANNHLMDAISYGIRDLHKQRFDF